MACHRLDKIEVASDKVHNEVRETLEKIESKLTKLRNDLDLFSTSLFEFLRGTDESDPNMG